GDPHAIGAALHMLGLVEGGTAGIGLLTEAVEVLAGSQARLEYAPALADLGAAVRREKQPTKAGPDSAAPRAALGAARRRENQRTEARQRLREGVDLAQKLGAFGLAGRANAEIAATGARPRRASQVG